ncbi:hypothetical protein [Aeoliella sp.]|uniref:hypothetical protein n=1 Tax=Aeoliella sp. TaxID=2795800 RepID=UPI003CCBBEF5
MAKVTKQIVDASKINLHTPLRHDNVDDYLPVLRWQWRKAGHLIEHCNAFEDWERGFLQDANPDREIVIWVRAIYSILEYMHVNPGASDNAVYMSALDAINGNPKPRHPELVAQLVPRIATPPNCLKDLRNFTPDGHLKSGPKHLR